MIDPAQRRLAAALIASVVLHGWLVHTAQGLQAPQHSQRPATANSVPLTVSFEQPPPDSLLPELDPRAVRAPHGGPFHSDAAQSVMTGRSRTGAAPAPVERSSAQTVTGASYGSALLSQPSDPTYYSALSLDVYPTAATKLDLGVLLAADPSAYGQVRATVLIDEAGLVNEVRAIEAVAPDIERAAREMLLHTRFTPARKDGRIVKAQVRVSLDYGAR